MSPKSFVRVRQREVGHKKRHRHTEVGRGREWSNEVTSQETLDCRQPQGTGRSMQWTLPQDAQRKPGPADPLISDFWIPEL